MGEPTPTPAPQPAPSNLPADSPWWARWMVENVKDAWKWASVRFGLLVALVAEAYAADPVGVQKLVQDHVPVSWWPHIAAIGGVGAVVFRIINLKGKP